MSATISNLTPAPVRRRGNGCGDGRRGGRDGGGVRRIYHLSSRLTALPLSARLCACLRIGETRARLGAVARRMVVVQLRCRVGNGARSSFPRAAGTVGAVSEMPVLGAERGACNGPVLARSPGRRWSRVAHAPQSRHCSAQYEECARGYRIQAIERAARRSPGLMLP